MGSLQTGPQWAEPETRGGSAFAALLRCETQTLAKNSRNCVDVEQTLVKAIVNAIQHRNHQASVEDLFK